MSSTFLFYRYASTRRIVAELINARTELIGSLVASFYAYDDLLTKASKGLEFYSKLNNNVGKVRGKNDLIDEMKIDLLS